MVAELLRVVLFAYAALAFILAVFYLKRRSLTRVEFLLWGGLALVVPIFGPFFVIAARPGPRKLRNHPRR